MGLSGLPTVPIPKRGRRVSVDYRALNSVMERRCFIIPGADDIKTAAPGPKFTKVGDFKQGVVQVDNEPETSDHLATLTANGSYFPRGLTFGPTHGPEDLGDVLHNVWQTSLT